MRLTAKASNSHICQKMVDKGYTVLFVCPTKRFLHELEGDAIIITKQDSWYKCW